MERSQWDVLRQVLRGVTRSMPRLPRVRYNDFLIACLYFWAVLHDRPVSRNALLLPPHGIIAIGTVPVTG